MSEKELSLDQEQERVQDPPSIHYLLKPDTTYTCYFDVGDPDVRVPVRIGACKLHLMAHSEVLRRMLQDSALAQKEGFPILDVEPDTFRNLMRFTNGHKDVSYLTLEEGVDLLKVAEKYLVTELKPLLAQHLASLVHVSNIFLPLQVPECYETECLKQALDQIVQYDTEALLADERFLDLNKFAILNIVKMDGLAVTEIVLWKALLRWAEHNGPRVRKLLEELLKYIRFCTLDTKDYFSEVVMANILSEHEEHLINRTFGSKEVQEDLNSVCNSVEPRRLLSLNLDFQTTFANFSFNHSSCKSYYLMLTKKHPVELIHAEVKAKNHFWPMAPEGLHYDCKCTISISRITDYANNTSSEQPFLITYNLKVPYGEMFLMPFSVEGQNVQLLANNLYLISVGFDTSMPCLKDYVSFDNEAVKVVNELDRNSGYYNCHVKEFACRMLKKKQ